MALPFGRQTSREAIQETTRNIRSSFTEGSSKIFGSVRKGLFDGISSTFDQVVNIVGTNEEEEAALGNEQQQSDQQKSPQNNSENVSSEKDRTTEPASNSTTSNKPRPPKPPAPPMNRQKSAGSNGSVKNSFETQDSEERHEPNKPKPPLKRRNTNPFMEDYEPSAADSDLPSTVVAEVYQMVSALYSEDPSKNQVPPAGGPTGKKSHDDGDSEGTEGCDDVNEVENDFDPEGENNSSGITGQEANSDPVARECSEFMKNFVTKVFESSAEITPKYKSKFCELSQNGFGRLWFAENIWSRKESETTKIADETFYALIQFFTIVLFECNESEDYGPAKSLMHSCFVFYCESDPSKGPPQKQFLHSFLKDLPIWHSPKFWNAAYFYALQHERASQNGTPENEKTDEISYKQLGLITHYMRLLGLNKDQCIEYIRRQAMTANLTPVPPIDIYGEAGYLCFDFIELIEAHSFPNLRYDSSAIDQVKQLKQRMERWVEGCDPNEDESSGAMWFISQKAKAVNAAARLLKDGFSFRGALKGDN